MRQPVETGGRENPISPMRFERVFSVGTHLRGRHYGQRSFVPHQQVEHMAAPTSFVRLQFALAKGEPSTQGDDRPRLLGRDDRQELGELLPDRQVRRDRQVTSSTAVGKKAAGSAFGGPKRTIASSPHGQVRLRLPSRTP